MTLAAIAGVGMTKFGKHGERTIEDIGREALIRAMKDAGVGRQDIGEVFCGSSYGGPLIGQRILRDLGMRPGDLAGDQMIRRLVDQHGDLAVEHGDVDIGADALAAHALEGRERETS
jgi:hypothetical protein